VPFFAGAIFRIAETLGGEPAGVPGAIVLIAAAAEIVALIVVVRYGENRLLGSVGIRPPDTADLKVGLGFGLGFFLLAILIPSLLALPASHASVAIGSHLRVLFPGYMIAPGGAPVLAAIAVATVAVIAEELAMRGFAASRLRTLTGSVVVGGALALGLDLAAHLPLWGIRCTVAIAPIEALLVGLFLWKRRLLPCVVANFTFTALVLILVAIAGTRSGFPFSRRQSSSALGRFGAAREQAKDEYGRFYIPTTSPVYPIVKRAEADADHANYQQAVAEMDKAIAIDPRRASLYSYRGVLYSQQNLHEQAIADFSKAISLRREVSLYWRQRAIEYTHKGDDDGAHRDYAKAIEINPKDPENYRDRAVLYESEKRYPEALRDIGQAIRLSPGNLKFYARRAGIHLDMRQYGAAIADCDQIVKLNPSSARGYGCRTQVYSASGDLGRALTSMNEYLKVSPGNVDVLYNRGDLELQLHRWSAARADFVAVAKNASRFDPEGANWAAMTLATNSHPEARDGKAAVALATHACEATGYRNAVYVATLAAAYAESGEFAQAIKWQKVTIGLERNDPRNRAFDIWVLGLYEHGKPLRDNEFPPARTHYALKATAGLIMMILMLIGLLTVIVWGVKLANRRRRQAAA
jgi:tetratricopeptide (TPR) repeat protein